jgi:hypothetical protein
MDTDMKLTGQLKLKVVRDDSIPAFGAWCACTCESGCEHQNTILLRLDAVFGPLVYEDGSPCPPMTAAEHKEMLISTLMHEFGHALEQQLGLEFSEERIDAIVETYARSN